MDPRQLRRGQPRAD